MVVCYPNIQATHTGLLAEIVESLFKFLKLSGFYFQACVELATESIK